MNIVYTYLCMDILHIGHILYIKNAKALAGNKGRLIVGILTDEAIMEKKTKPIISFNDRMNLAQAIRYIDLVIPQKVYTPLDNVRKLKPDILVESDSHSQEAIEEAQDVMHQLGGRVVTLPYYHLESSTDIKSKIKEEK